MDSKQKYLGTVCSTNISNLNLRASQMTMFIPVSKFALPPVAVETHG